MSELSRSKALEVRMYLIERNFANMFLEFTLSFNNFRFIP